MIVALQDPSIQDLAPSGSHLECCCGERHVVVLTLGGWVHHPIHKLEHCPESDSSAAWLTTAQIPGQARAVKSRN